MKMKNTRFRRTRNMAKQAAKFLGATVLAASIMLGSGRVQAQVKKPEKEKIGLGLTLGAGHEFVTKQPRAFAKIDANISLPLKSSIYAALGLNVPLRGAEHPIGLEELDIYLNTQLGPRLGVFAGGFISKHLWVDSLSPEGGMSVAFPKGFNTAASYIYLVGLEKPHLLLAKLSKEFLNGKANIITKLGWTIDSGGSGRIGIFIQPKENFPQIGLDTIVIFNIKEVKFADTTLSASWKF